MSLKIIVALVFSTSYLTSMHLNAIQFVIRAFDNQSRDLMILEQRNCGIPSTRHQFEPRRTTLCSPPLPLGCGFPSLFFIAKEYQIPIYFDVRYTPDKEVKLHLGKQSITPEELLHEAINSESTYFLVLGITPEDTLFLKPYAEYEPRVNECLPIAFYSSS